MFSIDLITSELNQTCLTSDNEIMFTHKKQSLNTLGIVLMFTQFGRYDLQLQHISFRKHLIIN